MTNLTFDNKNIMTSFFRAGVVIDASGFRAIVKFLNDELKSDGCYVTESDVEDWFKSCLEAILDEPYEYAFSSEFNRLLPELHVHELEE